MSGERSPIHAEIVLDAELPTTPERIFAAFADADLRRRWVRMPGSRDSVHQEFDLREGATEHATSEFAIEGRTERLDLRTTWLVVREPDLLLAAQAFRLDDVIRWTSLLTWRFTAAPGGALLTRTEQLAVLDPHDRENGGVQDVAHQRGGARLQLNGLVAVLLDPAGTAG